RRRLAVGAEADCANRRLRHRHIGRAAAAEAVQNRQKHRRAAPRKIVRREAEEEGPHTSRGGNPAAAETRPRASRGDAAHQRREAPLDRFSNRSSTLAAYRPVRYGASMKLLDERRE